MTAHTAVLIVLGLKIAIDSAAAVSFWRNPAQALMFFGFVVCDIAAVWIKLNDRSGT